jgi:hypothetical protein
MELLFGYFIIYRVFIALVLNRKQNRTESSKQTNLQSVHCHTGGLMNCTSQKTTAYKKECCSETYFLYKQGPILCQCLSLQFQFTQFPTTGKLQKRSMGRHGKSHTLSVKSVSSLKLYYLCGCCLL